MHKERITKLEALFTKYGPVLKTDVTTLMTPNIRNTAEEELPFVTSGKTAMSPLEIGAEITDIKKGLLLTELM